MYDDPKHLMAKRLGKADELETLQARLAAAERQRDGLLAALRQYRHCRHGCVDCFCVREARAAIAAAETGATDGA